MCARRGTWRTFSVMAAEEQTSISIDVERVTGVLLGAKWFKVDAKTFTIAPYTYVEPDGEASTPSTTGFSFRADGEWISGPIASILAVQTSPQRKRDRQAR